MLLLLLLLLLLLCVEMLILKQMYSADTDYLTCLLYNPATQSNDWKSNVSVGLESEN